MESPKGFKKIIPELQPVWTNKQPVDAHTLPHHPFQEFRIQVLQRQNKMSEKMRARRGRPPKDEVRLVPLTDISYVRQMESWMITTRPRRREPLWAVTDETMRNWLKQAVRRAEADGVHFSIPVTPHTFRHSYIMHMLYHRQPRKVIQALVGHKDPRSMEVYTRVFALDMAATLAVPFTGDGRDAAEILRTLPPLR